MCWFLYNQFLFYFGNDLLFSSVVVLLPFCFHTFVFVCPSLLVASVLTFFHLSPNNPVYALSLYQLSDCLFSFPPVFHILFCVPQAIMPALRYLFCLDYLDIFAFIQYFCFLHSAFGSCFDKHVKCNLFLLQV